MRRCLATFTLLLAATVLAGCGKKPQTATTDSNPPEVAEGNPAQPPQPDDPATPPAKAPSDQSLQAPPKPATTIPPFAVYPQPKPGLPVAPPPEAVPMINPNAPLSKLPPPPPVESKKPPEPKETASGSVKTVEWPTEIYGRSLADWVQDLNSPDPADRHLALRMIPGFGPVVRQNEAAIHGILVHMDVGKEGDPGVRAAAYETAGQVGFEKRHDTEEAVRLLFNAADQGGYNGGPSRLHAVQTLASFGPKAESAIPRLVGGPSQDRAYETRRSVANALGRIAFNEVEGPNKDALACLVRLVNDHSAPVRLEAAQSILLLGPPYLPRAKGAAPLKDVKGALPPLDTEAIKKYVDAMKKRLEPAKRISAKEKPSPTGLVERDKQVEIYLRLAIMRMDMKEMTNEEHLDRVVLYIAGEETGPKLQALTAIGMMGEFGARRLDDVVKVLDDPDPLVVNTAVSTLVAMGTKAEPAIPAIQKLKDRKPTATDPKEQEDEKKYWVKLADDAVKMIQEAGKKEMAPAAVAGP